MSLGDSVELNYPFLGHSRARLPAAQSLNTGLRSVTFAARRSRLPSSGRTINSSPYVNPREYRGPGLTLLPLHKYQFLLPALLRTRFFHPPRTTIIPTRKHQYCPPLHPRPLQRLFLCSWPLFPIPILRPLLRQLFHTNRTLQAQFYTRRGLEYTNQVGHELKLEDPLPTCAARRRRPATNSAGLERFCGRVVRSVL